MIIQICSFYTLFLKLKFYCYAIYYWTKLYSLPQKIQLKMMFGPPWNRARQVFSLSATCHRIPKYFGLHFDRCAELFWSQKSGHDLLRVEYLMCKWSLCACVYIYLTVAGFSRRPAASISCPWRERRWKDFFFFRSQGRLMIRLKAVGFTTTMLKVQ